MSSSTQESRSTPLRSPGITAADLAATALFAFEGAVVAAVLGFDVFGVLVVAAVSALGGGTVRDLVIGDVPTASVSDTRYLGVVALGAIAAVIVHGAVDLATLPVLVPDAVGLALFAVVGAAKADERGLSVLPAAMVGTIAAIGGGVMRDLLVGRVPLVLYEDVYATAALFAALVVAGGPRLGIDRRIAAVVGVVGCVTLRLVAHAAGWNLPST